MSPAASATAAGIERQPEAGREDGHHLARRGRLRVDPVGLPVGVVRRVVVDDDPRQAGEQLGVPAGDVPDPLERSAVGDHDQVVRRGGVRIGPEPLHAVEEVVQRRDRVGAHRIGQPAVRLDQPDDAERGPERVRVGVLVADREHAPGPAQAIDDGLRDGVEVWAEVDRHRVVFRGAWPDGLRADAGRAPVRWPRGRGGTGGRTADGGSWSRSSG